MIYDKMMAIARSDIKIQTESHESAIKILSISDHKPSVKKHATANSSLNFIQNLC